MKKASPNSLGENLYLDLFCHVLTDSRHLYPSRVSLNADLAAVRQRVNTEGLSFLTKTLPKLGKAIDRALETGSFVLPREFKTRDKRRNVPTLFQSWFDPVLGAEGLLVDVSPHWLAQARQATYLFYKLEFPHTPEQESTVLRSFVETESEIAKWNFPFDDWELHRARELLEEIFEGFDPKEILPQHGPGAVATGEKGSGKWAFRRMFRDLHSYYPYDEYFFVAGSLDFMEVRQQWDSLIRMDEASSKVVLVPKDSRGPRLIAAESLEKQFVQQGLGKAMVSLLEGHKPTKGQINFTDQEVNRKLALESSKTREFATLDLKDASDRVALELVRFLFPRELYLALLAARSTSTVLPDGRTVRLSKYASMGSALCFPVEACVFWALSVGAIAQSTGRKSTKVAGDVFVYGDDLIVRSEHVATVVETLTKAGLVVNLEKSFQTGEFRESCGMDAFRGVDVTPQKLHAVWNGRPGDGEVYASYVAYANGLAARGYKRAAKLLWEQIEQVYGFIPYGTVRSAYPCRIVPSWEEAYDLNSKEGKVRMSPDGETNYQHYQVFAKYLRSPKVPAHLESWRRLVRNLTSGPGDDPSHVTHPHSVQLKRGWIRIS